MMKNEVEILEELSELSTGNVKHYLMSDGTHRLVIQALPKTEGIIPKSVTTTQVSKEREEARVGLVNKVIEDTKKQLEAKNISSEEIEANVDRLKMSLQKSEISAERDVNQMPLLSMWGFNANGEPYYGYDSYNVTGARGYYSENIAFGIDLSSIASMGVIKNITITLTGSGNGGDCSIAQLLNTSDYQHGENIAYFGDWGVSGEETYTVNINKAIELAQNGAAYFCIYGSASYTSMTFISNSNSNTNKRPYLTVDYIPKDEILQGQKYYECSAGSAITCNVDILNGVPYIKNSLLNFGGEKLPLSLAMHFDASNSTTFVQNLDTGLGKGWYSNYHQYCYKVTNDGKIYYYYIDNNSIKHMFLPAINSTTLWADSLGTGLLLEVVNGDIKIYDEFGNYFLFDTYGRLITVSVKQSDTVNCTNEIEYLNNSSSQIKQITDGMGRVLTFEYPTTTQAYIKYEGINKILITKSSNVLKTIKKFGESTGDETSTYTTTSNRITGITAASGDRITLSYYTNDKVKTVYTTQSKLTQTFNYNYFSTEITSNKGITEVFYFNTEGEFITSYEKTDSEEKSIRFVSRDALTRYSGVLSDKKDIIFTFGTSRFTSYSFTSVTSSQTATSNYHTVSVANVNNYAVFSAMLEIFGGYSEIGAASDSILVELKDSLGEVLTTLEFNPNVTGVQFAAKPFKLNGSKTQSSYGNLQVKLTVNGRGNEFRFTNMWVTPLNGGVETLSSKTTTGGGYFNTSNDGVLYYVNKNTKVVANSQTYSFDMYLEDYLANERNVFVKTGNTWNMWVNKKRRLIADVTNATVYFNNNNIISFPSNLDLKFTLLTISEETADATVQSYNESDQIEYEIGKKSVLRLTQKSYLKSSTSAKLTFTQNGYYNSCYRFVAQTGSKLKLQNIYSSEGYLTETKSQSATNSSQNIISRREYGNGYLTAQKDYLLSTIATTSYAYDSIGNITKTTLPNAFDTNYTYNSYGDKLTQVEGTVSGKENKNDISYSSDKINKLSHNQFNYSFGYDSYNNVNSIKIQDVVYATMTYSYTNNQDTSEIKYSNGATIKSVYDKYNRLIKTSTGEYDYAEYYYAEDYNTASNATSPDSSSLKVSSQSKLYKIVDTYVSSTTLIDYNAYGNVSTIISSVYLSNRVKTAYDYDNRQRLSTETYYIEQYNNRLDEFLKVEYTYCTDNNAKANEVKSSTSTIFNVIVKCEINKDNLERMSSIDLDIGNSKGILKEYSYMARNAVDGLSSGTTSYLSTETYKIKTGSSVTTYRTDTYNYDINRNISSIAHDGKSVKYVYDAANRLTREDNGFFNRTYIYSYDEGGNIASKKEYNYTTTSLGSSPIKTYNYKYMSAFKDRLSEWNNLAMDYDTCGNPTIYKGKIMAWTRGRMLAEYEKSASEIIKFRYSDSGLRQVKVLTDSYGTENMLRIYEYSGDKLIAELYGIPGRGFSPSFMYYIYDCTGIAGFNFEGNSYYFVKNALGDVIQLRNASNNNLEASYEYDAWGNHKVYDANGNENTESYFIGNINPIRYRSYYYDTDMGMYYLNTRWYDPEIGRFINLDAIEYLDPETINGLNLYAYCLNNPVMGYDPDGNSIVIQIIFSGLMYIGFAIGAVFNEDIRNDMNKIGWNPFNSDESAVLDSSAVSFYKGVPVFRTDFDRSGSFYGIFLSRGWTDSNGNFHPENDPNTVRHEWGHHVQLWLMGTPSNYLMMIGLPSWREWSNRSYYKRPWEVTADVFGGVSGRSDPPTQADIDRGYWYLAVSTFFGPFAFFFLIGEY